MSNDAVSEPGLSPPLHPEFQAAVRAEQIKALYRAPAIMLINPINASILAVVLWPAYPAWILLLWIGLFCVVVGLRFVDRARYLRQPHGQPARGWLGQAFYRRRRRDGFALGSRRIGRLRIAGSGRSRRRHVRARRHDGRRRVSSNRRICRPFSVTRCPPPFRKSFVIWRRGIVLRSRWA